jgi:tRNA A-37 threonylcarbamoyl transferase component Bud32
MDLSGQVLDGRYRVIGPVGEGAMGSVYRAERLKLGRIVAVKVMNEQLPEGMGSRARFEREAMAMAKLEHPHCASVLDVGMHDDRPFVVMEFVSGANLHDMLREAGTIEPQRAVEITRQILSGLAHAHELGIIHRDIKPANVVLSQKAGLGDHAKILDFGLAKLNQETSSLTSGVVVGTPSYMSPEQIRGLLLDARVDLYACGVLLFELLTGTKPYRSANNDPLEVCMMHLNTPIPRLAERMPDRDFGALDEVIGKALAKDRDHRYASATEMSAALLEAVGRPPKQATPPVGTTVLPPMEPTAHDAPTRQMPAGYVERRMLDAPREPTRSRSGLGLAIVAVVLAVAAVVIVLAVTSDREEQPVVSPKTSADAAVVTQPPPDAVGADAGATTPDPVAELVERARADFAGRRHKAAIDALVAARRTYPRDARVPYQLGLIYFEKLYFVDGIKQLRAAFALEPRYRTDDTLITAVVKGFNAPWNTDWRVAAFLRDDIGVAAKPYLQEIAASHTNARVRARALQELRRYP